MTRTLDDTRRDLERWLTDHLGTGVSISGFERPTGGRSNDTVLFSASWAEDGAARRAQWVLRLQSATTPIFRSPDVLREAAVLRGLELHSAVPVPRVRWTEPDPTVLGAPFFVMDEIAGRVPLARPSIHAAGWLPELSPGELDVLWHSAVETVVAVHTVDWQVSHAFLLDPGETPSFESHVGRIAEWYRWSTAGREFPITDAALAAIEQRAAAAGPGGIGSQPVLVWGDARVGNMIFGGDHRVAAAIDWETATIGPPELDVAHWLFFDRFATSACGVDPLPGWPDRDEVLTTYEELSGRHLRDLELCETIDELFMATTLIRQADARVERGQAPESTRMGHDNPVTQMLARRLGISVPDVSPDYLAHRAGSA